MGSKLNSSERMRRKKVITQWQASGLTQDDYCVKHQIKIGHLKSWMRQATLAEKEVPSETGFVAIKVTAPKNKLETLIKTAPYCEILFEGKPGIRIETLESVSGLASLIAVFAQP